MKSNLVLLALILASCQPEMPVTSSILVKGDGLTVPVNKELYGLTIEEINHAVDGGIYAELIQNRSFEDGVLVQTIAAFLGSWLTHFPTFVRYASRLRIIERICQLYSYLACHGIPFPLVLSLCVPTVLLYCSTGISTCCPSATSFDLTLGPDLPRADQLYSGNLRYSAGRILTFLSLLIPAFSLLYSPQLLIGTASSRIQCSSTN